MNNTLGLRELEFILNDSGSETDLGSGDRIKFDVQCWLHSIQK